MVALLFLLACGEPAPPPVAPPDALPVRVAGDPSLDTLAAWLDAMGSAPERHGDILRFRVEGPQGPLPLTAQVFPEDHVVFLASPPLADLTDAADPGGVGRVLAEMAVRNYAATEGKLQLDPERGRVLLSIELQTDEGLGRPTFEAGVATLVEQAHQARAALQRALTAP